MPDIETVSTWEGRTLLDRDGGRIGIIDAIYLEDRTGEPEWAVVNTGLFGTKSSFIPLPLRPFRATMTWLSSTTSSWSGTPLGLTPTSTCRRPRSGSSRHYGLDYDTTGPPTDNAMTRSEEELRVRRPNRSGAGCGYAST